MSVDSVLNNWSDYDEKKIKNGLDPDFFSHDESWEIHYLRSKIRNVYPQVDDLKIFEAIEACSLKKNELRKSFVDNVLTKLGLT